MIDNVSYLHRSTAEKQELRKRLDNCLTHIPLQPNELVQADSYALSIFNETALILEKLGRADALFNLTVNRLALKTSEYRQIEIQKSRILSLIEDEEDTKSNGDDACSSSFCKCSPAGSECLRAK